MLSKAQASWYKLIRIKIYRIMGQTPTGQSYCRYKVIVKSVSLLMLTITLKFLSSSSYSRQFILGFTSFLSYFLVKKYLVGMSGMLWMGQWMSG